MQKSVRFVTKYPLSILCIALILILSFTPFFPETPLDNVQFIDKWTHLVMYGGSSSVIWWEYLRSHDILDKSKLLIFAVLGMIALGGIVELLQAYCTTTRSGEWLDFWSDTLGVIIGAAIGLWLNYSWFHKQYG